MARVVGGGSRHGHSHIAALVSLLLTHCCSALAILERKGSYVEDEPRRNYRVEDFFWSGSGDGVGSGDGHPEASWATTTIFMTTTVLTTVYPTPAFRPSSSLIPVSVTVTERPTSSCYIDCSILISPTPTLPDATPSVTATSQPWPDLPDQRFWLITILQANSTVLDLSPTVFEQRLARLYTTAFHRQQERHLGLDVSSGRRERREAVSVKVHQVSNGGSGTLELLYTVRVAGKAVDASVAAADMRLVAENEVTAQLGFPVLTKAEPYLKKIEAAPSSSVREIWLILGASVSTLLLIILLIIILIFTVKKRKSSSSRSAIFKREQHSGRDNMGFQQETPPAKTKSGRNDETDAHSAKDSIDGVASGAVTSPHPVPRPRTAKPTSPQSYLSMPSIKAFPRGAPIPGPLDEVLEPEPPILSRHSSASADPGVVGPLVWDLHCHRFSKKENEGPPEVEPSVGRMRRRFHELLDDAFSLFGSRSGTPDDDEQTPTHNIYGRAKSAVIMPVDPLTSEKKLRPKTSDGRPATAGQSVGPRGAWTASSPDSSPPRPAQPRPLSAGPFHKPTLEPAWILTDSVLKPTDPALPLIEAIKKELDKFPSTLPSGPKKL